MVVGGTDARLRAPGTQVVYTPMGDKLDSYDIHVEGAKLGDAPLPVPAGALAHVDTGTSFCYVPQKVFDAFKAALQTEQCVRGAWAWGGAALCGRLMHPFDASLHSLTSLLSSRSYLFCAFSTTTHSYCTTLPGVCPTADDPTTIFTEGPYTRTKARNQTKPCTRT